ncbi:zinc finger MYND domain-containing protein 12 isoform X1 [Protopterus annectens]|uniref:zinc finger MYND domain-containing protein 12 isoform X1 n=1 Tax=Protopterus annectens TaxID=7888 RepID=UPI001CFAB837|nr:zinc finger MYND domain-containing protein 12 isoform X1 [Protopterus annectens]
MTVNPLSSPKGIKLLCELCQSPAFIRCTKCRVSYYCDVAHQKTDWVGIHEKICQLLIPLRTPSPFLSSIKERHHYEEQLLQRQKHIVELAYTVAQKLLFEGKHEEAIPAALQSLRFSIDIHGLNSVQLVPSLLLLAEANIGLGHLVQAEEYLSRAQWTVLKTPDCDYIIRHKLYRNLGLLYAAKGDFEESLLHFANDVYYASEVFGTGDIHISGGYFHMANVFFRQNKMSIADSLYTEVTDIWHSCLSKLVKARSYTPEKPVENEVTFQRTEISAMNVEWLDRIWLLYPPLNQLGTDYLSAPTPFLWKKEGKVLDRFDEAQEAEAVQVLNVIFDIREQDAKQEPIKVAKIAHALSMLYYLLRDLPKASEFGEKAQTASKLVPKYGDAETIEKFLKLVKLESE